MGYVPPKPLPRNLKPKSANTKTYLIEKTFKLSFFSFQQRFDPPIYEDLGVVDAETGIAFLRINSDPRDSGQYRWDVNNCFYVFSPLDIQKKRKLRVKYASLISPSQKQTKISVPMLQEGMFNDSILEAWELEAWEQAVKETTKPESISKQEPSEEVVDITKKPKRLIELE